MALNKFFQLNRDARKGMTISDVLKRYLDDAQIRQFVAAQESTTIILEPFIIDEVFYFLSCTDSKCFLIAKNIIGDYIVEDEECIVSIASSKGAGKYKIYNSTPVTLTEGQLYIRILNAIVAIKFSEHLSNNFGEKLCLKDFDKDNFWAVIKICDEIKSEIKSLPSEAFLDPNGNINRLDLTLNLPRTQNMTAFMGLGVDTENTSSSDIPESIYRTVYMPKGSDFPNVLVSDAIENETANKKEFAEITNFNTTPERKFSIDEEIMLAEQKERTKDFVLSPTCKNYLTDYFDLSQAGMTPHSVAFYGPSGAGKSVMAQVIARELNRPFVAFKMRENSDEDSLRGNIKSVKGKDGKIEYEDSTIVKALKYGYVCEIQELSCCTNQGAETFFNNILDKTRIFEDASGQSFSVHPDALLVFTYNPTYCENNQVATSLLNRIDDSYRIDFPDATTFAGIMKAETGYTDVDKLNKIYNLCFGDGSKVGSIRKTIEEYDIEEEISLRQVAAWISRYINCRRFNGQPDGWLNAAESTIIQTLGQREPEIQADIRNLIETVM